MDSIRDIAISKIAGILARGKIVRPRIDLWQEIFNNAGQKELYEEYRYKLQCQEVNGTFGQEHENKPTCYGALHEIFFDLINDFKEFTELINSISSEINTYFIFNYDTIKNLDIWDKKYKSRRNEFLNKHPSREFKEFRSNINILGLDYSFDSEYGDKLIVLPFEFINKSEEKSILIEWLESNYYNILSSYQSAIKAYGEGDAQGTMSHCRNVMTGVFSYSKKDNTKWLTGLQKACNNDKNLENISTPNNIPNLKYTTKNDVDEIEFIKISMDRKYNYPRFKTIYQIYSYLSDLGPHINEAPLVNGIPNYEITSMSDALLGLRITEDILIWLYQNEEVNL